MTNKDNPGSTEKPAAPADVPSPPADAEVEAHEQATEDAGGTWSELDKDELRTLEKRGYKPGAQPAEVWRPNTGEKAPRDP